MSALIEKTRSGALKLNLLRKMVESNDVFKFGEFQLKSGQISPIYIDLRECFGYPDLLKLIWESLSKLVEQSGVDYSGVVGIPYAALPYSSVAVADYLKKPLLNWRKYSGGFFSKPGVNLDVKSDSAEQQWRGVDEAINIQQNDIVMVGRGSSAEPVQQLKRYRQISWEALVKNDEFV